MLSHSSQPKTAQETAAKTASPTTHQLPHQTWTASTTVDSTMTQKTLTLTFLSDKHSNTVKPLEAKRRSNSTMLRRDSNSDNNMRARRRLSCAEISRCMAAASSVTPAHMHMDLTNFRRRPISQATSWPSSAPNITEMVPANMVRDANSYTVSMTLRLNWHTPKPWRKEPDLPNKETPKSVVTHMLTASGPTWRPVMDVVHQRSQDLLVSNKSIIRKTFKRTWDKSNKRMPLKEPQKLQHQSKPQFRWATSNNQWWWSSTHTTKTSTTATKSNNHNSKAIWASTNPTKWCSNNHSQLSQT